MKPGTSLQSSSDGIPKTSLPTVRGNLPEPDSSRDIIVKAQRRDEDATTHTPAPASAHETTETVDEWLARAAQRLLVAMHSTHPAWVAPDDRNNARIASRSEARAIALAALGWSRAQLLLRGDVALVPQQRLRLDHWLEQRCDGHPLAHLTGHCAFWSLDLVVTPACLVPRPDSEILVEQALLHLKPPARFLDLGTGTGAIAAAIGHSRPEAFGVATDQDLRALDCAKANLRKWAPNVVLIACRWLKGLSAGSRAQGTPRFSVMVSNPPYLAADDPHLNQDSLRREPRSALVASGDGLDDIRTIIAHARELLEPDGWLLLEHGAAQGSAVRSLFSASGYQRIETVNDWAGLERVTKGCQPADPANATTIPRR